MRKYYLIFLIGVLAALHGRAQNPVETITISDDIALLELAEGVYMHVTEEYFENFGRVSSNGLLIIGNGEAVMIDTPANEAQTEALSVFIKDRFGAEVSLLIPTHWHDDCLGGIDFLHSGGTESLAHEMTREICAKEGVTVPRTGFIGLLELACAGKKLHLFYPGGGHSFDNIVVWLPEQKILFGGCLVKSAGSTSLGNLSDADVASWPGSIINVMEMYPDAAIVIPGHGDAGGIGLLEHTLNLFQ